MQSVIPSFHGVRLWAEVIMGRTGNRIVLSDEERATLEAFVSSGNHSAKIIRRAQIVLGLDASNGREPLKQADVAKRFGVSKVTVFNVKHDFENHGVEGLLARKRRETPPVPAKVDGDYEAHLIALSCAEPPEGYSRWTVRLLADKSVELGLIDSISHMTVSRVLKKTNSNLI